MEAKPRKNLHFPRGLLGYTVCTFIIKKLYAIPIGGVQMLYPIKNVTPAKLINVTGLLSNNNGIYKSYLLHYTDKSRKMQINEPLSFR